MVIFHGSSNRFSSYPGKEITMDVKIPFTLHIAQSGDIPAWMSLVDLVKENFPGLDMEDYQRTLEKNIARGTTLCAKADDQVIGVLLYSPKAGCLSCMAVHPKYRKMGVGAALVRMMIERFPEDSDITVTTFREGNPMGFAPRALYKKLGFKEDELTLEFGYPTQKFIYRQAGKQQND